MDKIKARTMSYTCKCGAKRDSFEELFAHKSSCDVVGSVAERDKIAEIRNKSEVGRIVRVQANTVHDLMADIRFLLSELELMSEENRKLREERDEDKKYIEDLDNYRRKLEGQLQSEQQEIERLNEELLHAK